MKSESKKGKKPARDASILVVEDEWIIAVDVRRILLEAGYRVPALCTRPAEVVPAIETHNPDLLLMDIRLGGTPDGLELTEVLQQGRGVPVVFVSAHSDPATIARAKALQPAGFIVKPFSEHQLLTTVELALAAGRPTPQPAVLSRTLENTLQQLMNTLAAAGLPLPAPTVPARSPHSHTPGPVVPGPGGQALDSLTAREQEIVSALLANKRVSGIARQLDISPFTVRNHLKSIFQKLGVHSQEELIEALSRDHTS